MPAFQCGQYGYPSTSRGVEPAAMPGWTEEELSVDPGEGMMPNAVECFGL